MRLNTFCGKPFPLTGEIARNQPEQSAQRHISVNKSAPEQKPRGAQAVGKPSKKKASQSSCGRSRRNQIKIRHFRGHKVNCPEGAREGPLGVCLGNDTFHGRRGGFFMGPHETVHGFVGEEEQRKERPIAFMRMGAIWSL